MGEGHAANAGLTVMMAGPGHDALVQVTVP